MEVTEAIETISKVLEDKGVGTRKTNFKLRDWVFSDSVIGVSRFR